MADHHRLQTQALMEGVFDSYIALLPVMNDSGLLDSEDQRQKIIANLENLKNSFDAAEHIAALQTPSFMPSIETFGEHIDETIRVVRTGNKNFAQMRMKAMTSLCMTCHTQLPDGKSSLLVSKIAEMDRSKFASDYDYAEFLFLNRNYLRSVRYYERAIQTHLHNLANKIGSRDIAERELRRSFRRVLSIYTKVNYMPSVARSFMEKFVEHRSLPGMLQVDMRHWIKSLRAWERRDLVIRMNSPESVNSFIEAYLVPLKRPSLSPDDRHEVTLLIASGVLTKFLAHRVDDELEARALFWLARAERQLNYQFFYSLSELYLRDCIKNYPKTSYAQMCLDEYRESLIYGYSGSAGIDIPDDEQEKLKELEEFLERHRAR